MKNLLLVFAFLYSILHLQGVYMDYKRGQEAQQLVEYCEQQSVYDHIITKGCSLEWFLERLDSDSK